MKSTVTLILWAAALILTVIAMAVATCMVTAPRAHAAEGPSCGPLADILAHLKSTYSEIPAVTATLASGATMTVTVSPTGSFTVLVSPPDSPFACLMLSGEKWAGVVPKIEPPKIEPNKLERLPGFPGGWLRWT